MELKNKVAVVTGSSSGIGEAIAKALAVEGMDLIINSRKNTKKGEKVSAEIKKLGVKSLYIRANLSIPGEASEFFSKASKTFGDIDVLINNAGESRGGEFEDVELWKYQFENILLSQVIAAREFLELKSNKLRKIVNTSSIYGSNMGGNLNFIAYSAMKAAVNSMTVNLAKKLGGKVLVNAVAPGWTWTPPWGTDRKKEEQELKGRLPIERFVEPEEIAQMVVAILRNDALTGQIITVDGGATLKDLY